MESKEVFPELIKDIQARSDHGQKTYGKALETFSLKGVNGPSLQDVYEECLDMAVYLKRELMEREVIAVLLRSGLSQGILDFNAMEGVLEWLEGTNSYPERKPGDD